MKFRHICVSESHSELTARQFLPVSTFLVRFWLLCVFQFKSYNSLHLTEGWDELRIVQSTSLKINCFPVKNVAVFNSKREEKSDILNFWHVFPSSSVNNWYIFILWENAVFNRNVLDALCDCSNMLNWNKESITLLLLLRQTNLEQNQCYSLVSVINRQLSGSSTGR